MAKRPPASIPVLLLSAVAFSSAPAHADDVVWLPGNSREVSRNASASLDASVTGLVFAPRDELKAAADLAILRVPFEGVALRPGLSGFCDVQYANAGGFWPIPPSTGQVLFRGHYEFSVALSAERLARNWLGPRGAFEIVLTAGHESDHVLGSGSPDSGFLNAPGPGDIVDGGGGSFTGGELAVRVPVSTRLDAWARVADRAYFRGAVLHEPSLEGGVRWHLWHHVEPLVSLFGEALLVDPNQNHGKDGGDVQLLTGPALPGSFGEIMPFVALDVGNQKGLLINHREADVLIGVRYAPF